MVLLEALLTFILVPLGAPGIVRKVRARAQGRKGPPLLQPWRDVLRMISKDPIDEDHSGFFAEFAPLFSMLAAVALWSLVAFRWGPMLMAVFFLIAQMASITAYGQETGTSFGGLGASREFVLALLAKPTLIILFAALGTVGFFPVESAVSLGVAVAFLVSSFLAILAETARPPFDDPRTHLELTMVHEAMLLEASGRSFAFFSVGAILKDCALLMMMARAVHGTVVHYFGWNAWLSSGVVAIAVAVVGAGFLGFWEAVSVRRRWSSIPETLGLSFLLSLFFGAWLLGLGGAL